MEIEWGPPARGRGADAVRDIVEATRRPGRRPVDNVNRAVAVAVVAAAEVRAAEVGATCFTPRV